MEEVNAKGLELRMEMTRQALEAQAVMGEPALRVAPIQKVRSESTPTTSLKPTTTRTSAPWQSSLCRSSKTASLWWFGQTTKAMWWWRR